MEKQRSICREQYLLKRVKTNYNRFKIVLLFLNIASAVFIARNIFYSRTDALAGSLVYKSYFTLYVILFTISLLGRILISIFYNKEKYRTVNYLIAAISFITYLALVQLSLLDSFDFNAYDYSAFIFGSLMLSFVYRTDNRVSFSIFIFGMIYFIVFYRLLRPDIFRVTAMLPLVGITGFSMYFSHSRERMHERLFNAIFMLEEESRHDVLTGLHNRRFMEEFLLYQLAVYKRQKINFCVIFADIDFFKKVNDILGHSRGDAVLTEFGKVLTSESRDTDAVIRYGGEEFVMILSGTKKDEAKKIAERIRYKTENHIFVGIDLKITASFGVAEVQEDDDSDSIIDRADKNLYIAKSTGRNQCC